MLGALDGDDVRQPEEPGLCRGVVGGQGLSEDARRRGDEHEAAVALRLHHPERRLAHVEAAVEVHVQHASPVVRRELVERQRLEDAGVAHDGIEATEPVDGGVDDRLATLGAGDRVVRGNGDATGLLDLVDDLVGDAGSAPSPDMVPPMSLTTTDAPRRARSSAYRRPRPRPAPVTITTWPEKSITVRDDT